VLLHARRWIGRRITALHFATETGESGQETARQGVGYGIADSYAILELVPGRGGAISNKRLLAGVKARAEAAGWTLDEATFLAVKARLIGDGVLAKGRGRGGSVSRIDSGSGGEPRSTRQPARKLASSPLARRTEPLNRVKRKRND